MNKEKAMSHVEQWQEFANAKISELRLSATQELLRSEDVGASVGALGVRLEQQAQAITNGLGIALMRDVLELADTSASEVEIDGVRWGHRRVQGCTYETIFGEVHVSRSTYQVSGRGRVAVPLELRLGIVEGRYTPLVARIANQCLARMPTTEAETLLEQIGVCRLSRSTLHRLPQAMLAKAGPQLDDLEDSLRLSDKIPEEAFTVQVALDGVMVPMDGEDAKARGRKTDAPALARHEVKYGIRTEAVEVDEGDGDEDDATSVPATGTKGLSWREAAVGTVSFWDKDGELLKTTYLGEMPSFRKGTLAVRLEREFSAVRQARPDLRVVLASDGAPTQWTILRAMAKRVMGDGKWVELLDFFHAASRLGTAAKAIWGTSEEATVQGEHWKTVFREKARGATSVIKSIEHQRSLVKDARESTAETLTKVLNYLTKQKKENRLNYADAKKAKLPIGTGVTEAAAKTLVTVRMKRSGARYTMHGGQTILTLRAALLSERFENFSSEMEAMYTACVAA
jgi:DNA-binding transcriptional regulator/RsmH inhibitor MraZ